jgi:hypothetical protein
MKQMLVPEFQYGMFRDVKRDCHKLIKRMAAGETWEQTIGTLPLVDLQQKEGLILLEANVPRFKSRPHYHSYLLLYEIIHSEYRNSFTREMHDVIFENSLQNSWGTLSLIARANQVWLWQPRFYTFDEWRIRCYEPFLAACLTYWDELNAQGQRYTHTASRGQNLGELLTMVNFVLGHMGVPEETLEPPLPSGGLPELVALAHEKVAAGWQGLNQEDVN